MQTIMFASWGTAVLAVGACLGVAPLRRRLITPTIFRVMSRLLPRMSETERVALQAGTVWWDAELFSGSPNWQKLLDFDVRALSIKERAFLDGPVETLCRMVDDWRVLQDGDLSPEVWAFIKQHRFFAMVIPEQYGGLGFSAAAHSAVVTKLASRSVTAAVTVMVPNSLGPAELLLHYGTPEQQQHYLPRLAQGLEIPCFALTGPEAGSDAAATESLGIVCRGEFEGRSVLGMRLNWHKRYTTLAPVATLIGLAFQLRDPEKLLGDKEELGITVALIPSRLPGIEIGQRHDPLGIPFQNGPNSGKNVFVPLDFIVGGPQMAGQGWRMLMESLSAGRSISLPALSVGAAELATRVVGAYATVREQFNLPIGRFEGIEEPLARIGGLTYMMNAARVLTAGAVDAGEKPAVVSAMVKCYSTELMRKVLADAMDILGGAAISRGPRNMLERAYAAAPLGITVEGANILTRTLIVFGQGAIRCHPYAQREMAAVADNDLVAFDAAFFGHLGFVLKNMLRAFGLALTGGRFARVPGAGPQREYLQQLTRLSAAFALVADFAMATLGGELKRREKITGRMADALGHLYLASAALKRCHDEHQGVADEPLLRWSCEYAVQRVHEALAGVLDNLPNRPAAWLLHLLVFPFGSRHPGPSDALGAQVAQSLLDDRQTRADLTRDIFIPAEQEAGLGRLEAVLHKVATALSIKSKVREARRARSLQTLQQGEALSWAVDAGVISDGEHKLVLEAERLRDEVIAVDAFDPSHFTGAPVARRAAQPTLLDLH